MKNSNDIIGELLESFKGIIGEDYHKYRNHVLRVYENCLLLDSNKDNEIKYAIASAFHDIGIWTKQTIDYLEPSIAQAKIYLNEIDRKEWIEEISLMIYWHHKLSAYNGKYAELVSNFRKADWIDVSIGILKFGLNKTEVKKISATYPNLGFHLFLVKKIALNFLKHPLHPFPMFKN